MCCVECIQQMNQEVEDALANRPVTGQIAPLLTPRKAGMKLSELDKLGTPAAPDKRGWGFVSGSSKENTGTASRAATDLQKATEIQTAAVVTDMEEFEILATLGHAELLQRTQDLAQLVEAQECRANAAAAAIAAAKHRIAQLAQTQTAASIATADQIFLDAGMPPLLQNLAAAINMGHLRPQMFIAQLLSDIASKLCSLSSNTASEHKACLNQCANGMLVQL